MEDLSHMPKTMHIVMTTEQRAKLRHLAADKDKGMSETVRDAIDTEDFLWRAQKMGAKVLLRGPDGTIQEVTLK